MDLVGVSPAREGGQDAASAFATDEHAKRAKHTQMCASHRFDFLPFGFSSFGSFGPAAHELLDVVNSASMPVSLSERPMPDQVVARIEKSYYLLKEPPYVTSVFV